MKNSIADRGLKSIVYGLMSILMGCTHTVFFQTDPPGAIMEIDGKEMGETPVIFHEGFQPYHTYEVRIKKEGYEELFAFEKADSFADEDRTIACFLLSLPCLFGIPGLLLSPTLQDRYLYTLTPLREIAALPSGIPFSSIAILDIVPSSPEVKALSDQASSIIRDGILHSGRAILIERGDTFDVLEDNGIDPSACTSNECIVNSVRLLNTNFIISGSLSGSGEGCFLSVQLTENISGEIKWVEFERFTCTKKGMRGASRRVIKGLVYWLTKD